MLRRELDLCHEVSACIIIKGNSTGNYNNHIAEHYQLPNCTIDWDSVQCLTYSTNYCQCLTLESWFSYREQTHLHRCQQPVAPYKQLFHDINVTNQLNRRI